MVIADGEPALIAKGEMRRKIGNAIHDLADELFEIDGPSAIFHFGKVMDLESYEV